MTSTCPDVVTIRGAPGTGKTETSKCLAHFFPKGVRLEVDTLRFMVINSDWTNQAEHINILNLSTNLVAGFLDLGFRPVIVVDTFSGDKLTGFLAKLRSLDENMDVHCFAMVVAAEALKARVERRPADHYKDIEVCQKLNSDTVKHLQSFEQLIDNTELTPEQTAEAIYRYITGFSEGNTSSK